MPPHDPVLSALEQIFSGELDRANLKLALSDSPKTVDGWDSLAHVRIMAAIESHFSFQFELSEFEELCTIESLVAAIARRA